MLIKKTEISAAILKKIKQRKKTMMNSKLYRRLLFLEMKHAGMKNKQIAALLDVSVESLSIWSRIYQKGGLNLLCSLQYDGRRPPAFDKIKDKIKKHVETNNVSTLKELKAWLKAEHKLDFGIAWIQRYCKKNSIFLIKKPEESPVNVKQNKPKRSL